MRRTFHIDSHHSSPTCTAWDCPSEGTDKINFDGAIFRAQHSADIGVIAREFSGLPIVVLTSVKTCCVVEVAQEMARAANLRAVIFA
nr:hypothetical protein CFP56_32821 [Quercus suber]